MFHIFFCDVLKKVKKILTEKLENAYIRVLVGAVIVILINMLLRTTDYMGAGTDLKIAGVLHDVAEDTDHSLNEIEELFSSIDKKDDETKEEIKVLKGLDFAINEQEFVGIMGKSGCGKTTLLRDLIRQLETSEKICVVDERGELFPEGIPGENRVDILYGCGKRDGILMLLRTMGPTCIAVDEITSPEDTSALLQAANCGVRLLATAHAASVTDLRMRKAYRPLVENPLFGTVLVLRRDKSYTMERMTEWVASGSVQY